MAARPEQRAALLAAKLRALVRENWAIGEARSQAFAAGAGLLDAATGQGWVLVDEAPTERDPLDADRAHARPRLPNGWLGGAIVWFGRHDVRGHILADHAHGDDARRAALFSPAPAVWRSVGRAVERVEPIPFRAPPAPAVDALAFAAMIEAAGAEPVVEHGVLRAEVLGLEVGRVVLAPHDGAPVLEVGVGRHDRLAQQVMQPDVDVVEALRRTVAAVLEHRRLGAASHPANRLARARWLRSRLCACPAQAGASALEPMGATYEPDLDRSGPAMAVGTDLDGAPLVVGCSTGLDLDAVGHAADAWAALAPSGARLVLVVPEGDDHPVIRSLAAALAVPATVRTVPLAVFDPA